MANHALHPQQGTAESKHDDDDVRQSAQTDIEEHNNGQTHQQNQACTGLQFSVHFNIHALSNQQGNGGSVVRSKLPFEIHVRPFSRTATRFLQKFEAHALVVLGRVKNE